MSEDSKDQEKITEKIKIMATDDDKIKSFGELLTNDSSRSILQLLFNEELTALQISEKSGISLQLVKYHIIKLQDLGVVKVTKIEKNSKSQDMKFYSASKFSMVIVPPKYSEKTKESKLLVRSFKNIYKIAGFGIAAGISGLMSLSLLRQEKQVPVQLESGKDTQLRNLEDVKEGFQSSVEESAHEEISDKIGDESFASAPSLEPIPESTSSYTLEEALEIQKRSIEAAEANPSSGSGTPMFDVGDLSITLIIITIIFGGLAAYFFLKSIRQSKPRQLA
ncbi:MAG: winged helix-turn-helix domain-containing protein [Nitrosopumilus sp.]|nr:winged helix-turn-helix domain-containing protein [Nitrosopumilus sp.]MDH3384969.1 winged helix-turn-helix domain-containing protein [Nitrosopumilus sp.]